MRNIFRLSPMLLFIRFLIILLFCIMLVVYIYPLIWVTLSGFKTSSELLLTSFQPPKKFRLENFIGVWKVGISDFYLNSIIITTASCVFTTICASLAAFCLSRYRFKTRKFWFMFLLCGLMLAPQVSLISNFKLLQFFHLYDTYLALILTYTAFRIPFTMFLVWSYFMTLPLEIEEAACIDGCTSIQTLVMIVVPMSRPIIATSILLTARYVWNDFLFSLVFTRSQSLRTIPYGLYSLRGESGTNWGYLMAGMTLAAIPMIILFICTQKQFIRGLAVGGVKG